MTDEVAQEPMAVVPARESWPWWGRFGFRVAIAYWAMFLVTAVGSALDDISKPLSNVFTWPLGAPSLWLGIHVFHLTGEAATWHPTGSSDTALAYIEELYCVVVAVVAAMVWSAIAERAGGRKEYRTAYAWLRLVLRFVAAFFLLLYGFIKIFPDQMPAPSLLTLTETYGESSPMHLLWTFLGASPHYQTFGGLMEASAGVLLLFRRTSTLGAMAGAAVMLNVVALNFFYDVPVKIFSMQLLLLTAFLLLPDLEPLWRFFVRREPAVLTGVWVARRERRPLRIGAHVLQGVVVALVLGGTFLLGYTGRSRPGAKPSLYGIWAADKVDGLEGEMRWSTFLVDNPKLIAVVYGDGLRQAYQAKIDEAQQTIELLKVSKTSRLHWSKDAAGVLTLTGVWAGRPVTVQLHRTGGDAFPLQTRGFHWVQERAVNR